MFIAGLLPFQIDTLHRRKVGIEIQSDHLRFK